MPFLLRVRAAAADIDFLGHVGNLVYLRWVLDAALAHSTDRGLDEKAYTSRGQGWVVRRHEIDYLRAAFEGDELVIETRVASLAAASSLRRTRILRGGEVLARAATSWAYVDFRTGRPIRIPEEVSRLFAVEPDEPGDQDRTIK
jgi:acyl-CoA thioester hydrolase